jgi:hypothetical protein
MKTGPSTWVLTTRNCRGTTIELYGVRTPRLMISTCFKQLGLTRRGDGVISPGDDGIADFKVATRMDGRP